MSRAGSNLLPNGAAAFVDDAKLLPYVLAPDHPRGRHKARVFSALGVTTANYDLLKEALLGAAATQPARRTVPNAYGERYIIDFEMAGPAGRGRVRSAWIVPRDTGIPCLTTCYVL